MWSSTYMFDFFFLWTNHFVKLCWACPVLSLLHIRAFTVGIFHWLSLMHKLGFHFLWFWPWGTSVWLFCMLCLSCNLVSLPQILVLVVGGIKHWSCFYSSFVGLVICIFFFSKWLCLVIGWCFKKKEKKEIV